MKILVHLGIRHIVRATCKPLVRNVKLFAFSENLPRKSTQLGPFEDVLNIATVIELHSLSKLENNMITHESWVRRIHSGRNVEAIGSIRVSERKQEVSGTPSRLAGCNDDKCGENAEGFPMHIQCSRKLSGAEISEVHEELHA